MENKTDVTLRDVVIGVKNAKRLPPTAPERKLSTETPTPRVSLDPKDNTAARGPPQEQSPGKATDISTASLRAIDGSEKRGPGRPRKQPPPARIGPVLTGRPELAEQLGVSVRVTYDLEREDPDFPVVFKVGSVSRFRQADIDAYIQRKVSAALKARKAARKANDQAPADIDA